MGVPLGQGRQERGAARGWLTPKRQTWEDGGAGEEPPRDRDRGRDLGEESRTRRASTGGTRVTGLEGPRCRDFGRDGGTEMEEAKARCRCRGDQRDRGEGTRARGSQQEQLGDTQRTPRGKWTETRGLREWGGGRRRGRAAKGQRPRDRAILRDGDAEVLGGQLWGQREGPSAGDGAMVEGTRRRERAGGGG